MQEEENNKNYIMNNNNNDYNDYDNDNDNNNNDNNNNNNNNYNNNNYKDNNDNNNINNNNDNYNNNNNEKNEILNNKTIETDTNINNNNDINNNSPVNNEKTNENNDIKNLNNNNPNTSLSNLLSNISPIPTHSSSSFSNIEDSIEIKTGNTTPTTIKIKCKLLPPSILSNSYPISVTIKNPKPIQSSNFFQNNYVEYEIETITNNNNIIVKRRYSDFEWLRNTLLKNNPGLMIPPLPNKKMGSRRFELSFIEKRMKFLQNFIDNIITNKIFLANESLVCFLTENNKEKFLFKMKELNNYVPSSFVEDLKTLSGYVLINSNDDNNNEIYFENIKSYFKINDTLLYRLNYNLKEFNTNINNSINNLKGILNDLEMLFNLNKKVLMKDQITLSFENLLLFFKDYKNILENQNILIKNYIKDFFKYNKMKSNSYFELIKNRENIRDKYLINKKNLLNKKEYLFNKDIKYWEINSKENIDYYKLKNNKEYAFEMMLTNESILLESEKKKYGYVNRMNIEELKKYIANNCKTYIENIDAFIQKFYLTITDLLNAYARIQIFIGNYKN